MSQIKKRNESLELRFHGTLVYSISWNKNDSESTTLRIPTYRTNVSWPASQSLSMHRRQLKPNKRKKCDGLSRDRTFGVQVPAPVELAETRGRTEVVTSEWTYEPSWCDADSRFQAYHTNLSTRKNTKAMWSHMVAERANAFQNNLLLMATHRFLSFLCSCW
jgi:hypothetical protein